MKLSFLKLVNYRNYNNLELSFHPTLNIIYGKNGAGKTNLVEAIYVLALTRSFRIIGDKLLIKDDQSISKVEGIELNKYKTKYSIVISKEGKKVKINNNKVQKISDYITKIPIILFHPDDLRFIKDTPNTRRKTLNISISQLNIEYLKYLSLYNKLLKQRNSYLKQMYINHNNDSTYLDVLTNKLIKYGLYIYEERKKFVSYVNKYINDIYKDITGLNGLCLKYDSDYSELNKDDLMKLYSKSLGKDLDYGKTNIGIHTDDVKFMLDNKDLKDYGSEGQQKNAIISYKFSELEIFKVLKNEYPILILDDLFSELDQEKKDNILKLLKVDVQTFITTTDMSLFPSLEQYQYKQILIQDGNVKEENVYE